MSRMGHTRIEQKKRISHNPKFYFIFNFGSIKRGKPYKGSA